MVVHTERVMSDSDNSGGLIKSTETLVKYREQPVKKSDICDTC